VAVLRYTVLRIAIFIASLVVLSLIGVRKSLLMLVLAALISVILSFLLLGGPRDQLAQELARRVDERATRNRPHSGTDADAAAEDAAVDAAERAHEDH
jgi:Protein of unknown function (DUF4229)